MTAEQYKGRQIHPERSRVVRNYSGLCGLQLACRLGAQRKPLPVAQEVPQRTANVTPDNSDGVCVCVVPQNRGCTWLHVGISQRVF